MRHSFALPNSLPGKFVTGCAAVAMALSCAGMGAFATTALAADEPVYSPVEPSDAARNYAVNLPEGSTEAQLKAAVAEAEKMGDVVALAQYPQFGTFFVQAKSKSFAKDYAAKATADGISLVSVGATRQARVPDGENVVDKYGKSGASLFSLRRLSDDSQFAKEQALQSDPATTANGAWGVLAIGADKAADITDKDVPLAPVTVGVIDAGIDARHAEFRNSDGSSQIDASRSVGCQNNGIPDQSYEAWQPTTSSHGTHVAGTIAAASNGVGVDGVDPKVKIVAIKAGNDAGSLYPEYVVCAFDWAANHGIDVTNNSYYVDPWEFWVPSDPTQAAGYEAVRRAVAYATSKGVVSVAAAGNSDQNLDDPAPDSGSPNDVSGDPDGKTVIKDRDVKNGVDIPAQLPGVVNVSAVGETKWGELGSYSRASFSNYGAKNIDVAAPGLYIYSSVDPDIDGGSYSYYSGTSMASPHAAGVAALIKGIHPDYTPEQVVALMKKQAAEHYGQLADPSGDAGKEYRGAGLVNALAAVTKDQPQPTLSEPEYSTDGGKTWSPLKDATVKGKATVRVSASGPVSALSLTVAGKSGSAKAEKKAHDNALTVSVDVTFDKAGKQSADVAANGLNDYAEADDDVSASTAFASAAADAGGSGDQGGDKGNGGATVPGSKPEAKPVVKTQTPVKPSDGKIGDTGAAVAAVAVVAVALAAIAGAILVRRKRA
ncbi:S8 family peptidase [Bifidobacterium aerophilum]|uniref:S8 family serine peptidase n=1 Tax=Bifidobacterium aerophilum TaxID=1798155 RepID=A0A6N9Z6N3_9BIFI|nr:S8 family serine peptidase [Bifidobacterium aerophilum]NEG90369.1 S8 family serine peptidase [Bifidobacterium aerophilum]